jgi:two-component system response regulator VicR
MLKVLVIDDDAAMTDILNYHLTAGGMEVKVVNDGRNGLDSINDFNPNLILLDLLMPELDGWDVCRAIKSKFEIPIIILSAVDNPTRIAEALDAGADDYLIKPVSSESLIAHINNLVRRTNIKNSLFSNHNIQINN